MQHVIQYAFVAYVWGFGKKITYYLIQWNIRQWHWNSYMQAIKGCTEIVHVSSIQVIIDSHY